MLTVRTLARPVEWTGVGLHSGEEGRVGALPAQEGGFRILDGGRAVPLQECALQGDARGSEVLLPSGRKVRTVEHLFAALRGMGVDNVLLEVEGPEIPVLDGSALPFAEKIREVGLCELSGMPGRLDAFADVGVDGGKGGRCGFVFPSPDFRIEYVIDYPGTPIGTQLLDVVLSPSVFYEKIAPARTFCLESELRELERRSLARGGSLDNAVVVGEKGPLNPEGLRFPDEYVRHKVLDLIGDLALLNCRITGHFVLLRAGHSLHQALGRRLERFVLQGR
jgi:UDP-3-O-[3-hydroxymyristoyl] N-acetylglucosamine deacetylase